MRIKLVAAALLGLVLSACGGGGGGGTSISVSPKSLSFTVNQGEALPAAEDVRVRFSGDGMIAGYAEGVAPASWLDIYQVGPDESPTTIRLAINNTNLSPGTYRTTVSFFTARVTSDGEDVEDVSSVNLPVTYTVTPPFYLLPAGLNLQAPQGGAPLTAEFQVIKNDANWTASADQPWLVLTPRPGSRTLQLTANHGGLPLGVHTAVVTVRDTAGILPPRHAAVQLNVRAPTLVVPGAVQNLQSLSGQRALPGAISVPVTAETTPLAYSVSVSYQQGQAWLTAPASGNAPGSLALQPATTALPPGQYNATVILAPANGGATRQIQVRYTLSAATLGASGTTVQVGSSTTAADLSALRLGLTDDGATLNWQMGSPDVDWLTLIDTAGNTAGSAGPRFRINTAVLPGLANGSYTASIPVTYGNPVTANRQANATVTLDLSMARVKHVMPSYADSRQPPLPHVIRGEGFSRLGNQPLRFGSVTVSDFDVISDSEIHVLTPSLRNGNHAISVPNQLALDTSAADFAMVTTPAMPAYTQAREGSGVYRLIYDPRRQALYALEDGAVLRWRLVSGNWVHDRLFEHADLFDIAQSPDGRWLYLLVDNTLRRLDLQSPGAAPVEITSIYGWNRFYFLANLDVQNDGRLVMVKGIRGSGFIEIFSFDPAVGGEPQVIGSASCATLATSLDGRRTMVGNNCMSPPDPVQVVHASGGPVRSNVYETTSPISFAIDRTGRLMLVNTRLYTEQWGLLGSIPFHYFAMFSEDGRRLLAREFEEGYPYPHPYRYKIKVYDTSQPASRNFPLLGELPPVEYAEITSMRIAVTPDGRTAFLVDSEQFRVIPIPAELR